MANVLYETKLKNLDFTPSLECVEVMYINKDAIEDMVLSTPIKILLELFNSHPTNT